MNLQFISWDDLNAIKENLDQYVSKFALPSNAWIEEELGHSPFLNTKYPMPDIHLDMSQPMDKAYLTDAANVQEFYGKLSFISDSQASDERLWAGLCLGPFYEYTQYRWKIAQKCTKQDVKAHYFFGFGARRSLSRNALAPVYGGLADLLMMTLVPILMNLRSSCVKMLTMRCTLLNAIRPTALPSFAHL